MFGVFRVFTYGIVALFAWTQNENQENRARQSSKKIGLSYYYDKNGRQRWTSTGRKRSAQEILDEMTREQKAHERDVDKVMTNNLLEKIKVSYSIFKLSSRSKDVTFEEYAAYHFKTCTWAHKYKGIRKIINSVPEARIREIERIDKGF